MSLTVPVTAETDANKTLFDKYKQTLDYEGCPMKPCTDNDGFKTSYRGIHKSLGRKTISLEIYVKRETSAVVAFLWQPDGSGREREDVEGAIQEFLVIRDTQFSSYVEPHDSDN